MRLHAGGRLPLRPQRDRRHRRDALPGRARPRGRGRRRGGRRRASALAPGTPRGALVAAGLRRAARSACATCRTCARRPGSAMDTGGLLDGTPRLSRDGEPVYHYSFLSTFAERTVVPGALLHPDPGRRAVRRRRARRLRGHDRHRRGLADRRRAARRPRRGLRLRRRRPERGARRRRGRARTRSSPSTSRPSKLEAALRSARRTRSRGPAAPRRRPSACAAASGGGVDYAIEATGRTGGGARRVPVHARARRGGADRHPRARTPCCRCRRSRSRGWSGACSARSTARRGRSATSRRCSTLYRRGRLPLDRLVSRAAAARRGRGRVRADARRQPRPRGARARRSGGMSARTVAPQRSRTAAAARIADVEVRRYAVDLDPPFRAAWDPTPRATVEATLVIVRSDDGVAGYASGDDVPDAALLERLLVGVDPLRTEAVREIFETVDFHGGRPWTVEVAVWDLVGRSLGQPLWRLLGGRSERLLAYASSAEPVAAEERARRVVGAARPRRARGQAALPPRRLAPRRRGGRAGPRRGRPATSRSWSTPTRAGAWPATARRAGTSRPRRSAPARSSRSASTGSRSRCATDDVEGYALLRAPHVAADRGGRDGAQPVRGARPHPARRRRRRPARRRCSPAASAAAGGSPRSPTSAAARSRRTRGRTASACVANLHLAAARVDLPVPRGAARPAGLDARTAATGCSAGRRSRSPPTARSRRRPARASASCPTSTASRSTASPDGDPRRRPARGARPAARRDAHARPAARGRGARARRRGGRVPLRRPPRRRRPRRRPLADRAGPRGRGRGRGRRRGRGGARGRATRSRSASCRRAGPAPRARAGRFNLCEIAGAHAWAGTLLDGTIAAAPRRRARRSSTSTSSRASPSAASCRRRAPCRSRPSCRSGRRRCSGCAVVTGFGAVRNAARVAIGESVCVVGCGGIGQQIVAAARMAGAGRIVAVDRDAAKLALARGRGATDTVDASAEDPVAAVLALVPGGVDHALEAVGQPGDDPARMGRAAPRSDGDRRRHRAARRRGAACRRSTCSPRRRCAAATTARATRRSRSRGSGGSWPTAASTVADAVSHLTDLDGIEAAFERLRRGSGARTVAVIDPALAGAPECAGPPWSRSEQRPELAPRAVTLGARDVRSRDRSR